MLSLDREFLFIHVPKTGGNSIQNVLREWSEDRIITPEKHQDGIERFEVENPRYGLSKHATLSEYARKVPKERFDRLFKFAVMRNPFDRLISFYFSPHRRPRTWDRAEFARLVRRTPTLRHYVSRSQGLGRMGKRTPLDRDLDALLRFENLESEFADVCARMNLPQRLLVRRNASRREHYSVYYDEKLEALVEKRFAEEIEYGDYGIEPEARTSPAQGSQ